VTERNRRDDLTEAWGLMADNMLRVLRSESPSPAALEVVRKWLAANKATATEIQSWRAMLPTGLAPGQTLPTFGDAADGESGASETDDADAEAVRNPQPFSVGRGDHQPKE
jgi:hypothetical protein